MTPSRVAVVLPALDEAEALAWLLPRMPAGYSAVVVDNGSADSTAAVAEELGATLVREPRRGFGQACWSGLARAETEGFELVAFMDADGSLDPADLPSVARGVVEGSADLVLGRRVAAASGAFGVHARIANRWLARSLRHRYGLAVRDIGPMRAARTRALAQLGVADRRFGWPLEMVARAGAAGWRVREVDVPYYARRGGRSKVTGTVGGTLRTIRDMRRVMEAMP